MMSKIIKILVGTIVLGSIIVMSINGYSVIDSPIVNAMAKVKHNNQLDTIKMNKLTEEEARVIIHKGTEMPFTGKLLNEKRKGTFCCRQCGTPLYRSEDKFDSGCGWPSFDDEIPGAVNRSLDADGRRIEITCAKCGGHLGHVFEGEQLTAKNTRHCVNSLSMIFRPDTNKAYFAAGCFWGVQYYLGKIDGVLSSKVGYMGGHTESPTYHEVCDGNTGYLETVEVTYDPNKVSYEELVKAFFEIHDFTQTNGQGPDIGEQYLSAVFVQSPKEEAVVKNIMNTLEERHYKVATTIRHENNFYPAEDYHQDYYDKKGSTPYCHIRRKIF